VLGTQDIGWILADALLALCGPDAIAWVFAGWDKVLSQGELERAVFWGAEFSRPGKPGKHGLRSWDPLVWLKTKRGTFEVNAPEDLAMGMGYRSRRCHELIAYFTRGKPQLQHRSQRSVLMGPRLKGPRYYPTQKPLGVLQQLVEAGCAPGGWVLDPFAGSCSTGVAALLTGRNAVCIDPAFDDSTIPLICDQLKHPQDFGGFEANAVDPSRHNIIYARPTSAGSERDAS
jgi:hypothetical protein